DEETDEEPGDVAPAGLSRQELALRWVSYAVGIVMGRFEPGGEGALGSAIVEDWETGETRRMFPAAVETTLRGMADADGIAPLGEGHRDDLVARVERALALMLGEDESDAVGREV